MKKITAALGAFIFSAGLTFGLEWGGTFGNNTSFSGKDDLKLKQIDNLTMWLSVPFTKSNNINLLTQGSYCFKDDKTDGASKEINNIVDVDALKFSMNIPLGQKAKYIMGIGRFRISDASGYIFSQNSDGMLVKFSMPLADIQLYGGWTGLLNAKNVSILNSDKTSYTESSDDGYALCPKYLPFGVSFAFPVISSNQTLTIQGWGFKDFNGDDYDRWYGSLILDGYLSKKCAYNFTTIVGSVNFENLMNFTSWHYFIYPASGCTIKLGATYASGSEGPLESFKAFTSKKSAISMSEPEWTSLFRPDLSVSVIIASKVALNLGGAAFFKPEDYFSYKGFQAEGGLFINIFNDMQLGFSGGQYIGTESSDNKTTISASLSLAF